MKFFANINTIDELKKEYRRLTKIYHPDCGGSEEMMKAINAEYETRFNELQNSWNASHDAEHQNTEVAAEFIEIIEKLLKLDGLNIELCGSWLWISGNTKNNAAALKAAGCKWASKKMMWYWYPAGTQRKSHKPVSMANIRAKYGSQSITGSAGFDGFALGAMA